MRLQDAYDPAENSLDIDLTKDRSVVEVSITGRPGVVFVWTSDLLDAINFVQWSGLR